ncbi:hypothetical protein IJ670_05410 [bacterium]|nr:hypothetical protein [bacterium]
MYIIELFFKIIDDLKNKKIVKTTLQNEDGEKCSHTFFPIDSTGKILACSKCGEIHKIKEKNIFEDRK